MKWNMNNFNVTGTSHFHHHQKIPKLLIEIQTHLLHLFYFLQGKIFSSKYVEAAPAIALSLLDAISLKMISALEDSQQPVWSAFEKEAFHSEKFHKKRTQEPKHLF